MTLEELRFKLKDQLSNEDTEDRHLQMDRLLLAYVNDTEVTDTFDSAHKWYA